MQELRVQFLGREDPLEEEMATHSSVLAWRVPRTEELSTQNESTKNTESTESTKKAAP